MNIKKTEMQKAKAKWKALAKHTKITPEMVANFNRECEELYYK